MESWREKSAFDEHLARIIGNHLEPKLFGYSTQNEKSNQDLDLFLSSLKVKSVEMYMPIFTPLSGEINPSQSLFKELVDWLFARGIFSNELGKHSDLLDEEKFQGELLRRLTEDIWKKKIELVITESQEDCIMAEVEEEIPKEMLNSCTARARFHRLKGTPRPYYKENNAMSFVSAYVNTVDEHVKVIRGGKKVNSTKHVN